MDSRLDDLKAMLSAPDAEAFRASAVGDHIYGTVVVPIRIRTDGEFGPYPILVLRVIEMVENGVAGGVGELRALHGLGHVLSNEMQIQDPRVGDLVGADFKGEATSSKNGRPYKVWTFQSVKADNGPTTIRPTVANPVARPTAPVLPDEEPF